MLNYQLIASVGATVASVTYLLPVVAIILGFLVLVRAGLMIMKPNPPYTRPAPRRSQALGEPVLHPLAAPRCVIGQATFASHHLPGWWRRSRREAARGRRGSDRLRHSNVRPAPGETAHER